MFLHHGSFGWQCLDRVQRLGRGVHTDLAVGVTRSTLTRYVSSLTTFVAYFADCIQWAPVGSSAVARNMALVMSVTLTVEWCNQFHVQAFRMHSTSSLGLDNLERSDWVHHICSRWLGEEPPLQTLHGSHLQSLAEAQRPREQSLWVDRAEIHRSGKHACNFLNQSIVSDSRRY